MAGNIITAKTTITGIRPLWWHVFGPETLSLTKKEKTGVAGNDPQEWRKTVSATHEGQLYVDPTYVFGMIREGGRYVPKKRSNMMYDIAATLQVVDNRVFIDRYFPGFPNGHAFDASKVEVPPTDATLPVYLDVRGVRNPSTKARNVRYRVAAGIGWKTNFTIIWDKTVVAREQMEAAIIEAGRLVGLGNGRSIGMGRFTVDRFDVSD